MSNKVLTCEDFAGECCFKCHNKGINFNDSLLEIYKGLELFDRVCCFKINQAELRKDRITESIK